MINTIKILKHTQESYSQAIFDLFGKGRIHASLVYEHFFRTGNLLEIHPAFNNCPALLADILAATDFTVSEMIGKKHDGYTGKFLVKIDPGYEAESVVIPMKSGATLCVSSQVGCRMGCAFCETGRMGLLKNLEPEEIVSQVYLARHSLRVDVRNVVFMGMGEPFDNYDNVMQAARILQDPGALRFGRSRLTVSTSGCVPGILKMINEGNFAPNLAVSVNAPNDEIRRRLMPITIKHSMQELRDAMQLYCEKTRREILIAYVLLRDINDKPDHADELARYLEGLNVKINLIPYNPQTRDRFHSSDSDTIDRFAERLRALGYYTLLRTTKGQDIMAACGQLGNLELRKLQKKKFESEGS